MGSLLPRQAFIMKTTGNTVLITGGGSGIGLTFARKFLSLGNEVIVTGRNAAKLEKAKAANPGLHTIQSDVADVAQIRALAETMRSDFPKLNVLMNNAGIMVHMNIAEPADDLEALTREIDINVSGTIRVTSALIEQLKSNRGTIMNVSSGLAYVPLTSAPIYCATKAAMHSYTTSLRFHLQGSGVEVIELMPPATQTEMLGEIPEGDFKVMTQDELLSATMKALQGGKTEIRPGQSNQLHWMSRIAPSFINKQLYNGSKDLIPEAHA